MGHLARKQTLPTFTYASQKIQIKVTQPLFKYFILFSKNHHFTLGTYLNVVVSLTPNTCCIGKPPVSVQTSFPSAFSAMGVLQQDFNWSLHLELPQLMLRNFDVNCILTLINPKWQGKYFIDFALPFGLRSAPFTFSSVSVLRSGTSKDPNTMVLLCHLSLSAAHHSFYSLL